MPDADYQEDDKIVADRLYREWAATPVRVHAMAEYYRVAHTDYVQALESRGYRDDEIGTHAGLADTSLMLAVDPRLVRSDRLTSGAKPGPANGVYGAPRGSSAELGQLGVDAIVTQTVAAIRKEPSGEGARPSTTAHCPQHPWHRKSFVVAFACSGGVICSSAYAAGPPPSPRRSASLSGSRSMLISNVTTKTPSPFLWTAGRSCERAHINIIAASGRGGCGMIR